MPNRPKRITFMCTVIFFEAAFYLFLSFYAVAIYSQVLRQLFTSGNTGFGKVIIACTPRYNELFGCFFRKFVKSRCLISRTLDITNKFPQSIGTSFNRGSTVLLIRGQSGSRATLILDIVFLIEERRALFLFPNCHTKT